MRKCLGKEFHNESVDFFFREELLLQRKVFLRDNIFYSEKFFFQMKVFILQFCSDVLVIKKRE